MKETFNFLNQILKKDDVIVVACSGGPDSMYLLHVLNSIKSELNLKIICAHVNHGLREESKEEAVFVENFCKDNNIIFEFFEIEKYNNSKFTEDEARKKRYSFFNVIIDKYNAQYLMTAHHADDLAETILMRIVRGSNLKGYAGISKILENYKYKIVRPLINISKDYIIKYLTHNNIPYVLDKSNDDEKYTRNRFRKRVLPELKKEDSMVHLKFLKYSEELSDAQKYINRQIDKVINEIYVDNYILINKMLEIDEFLQKKLVEYIIEDIQKQFIFNISDNQLNNIMKLIKSKNNNKIDLANGFIARKNYNKLFIEKNITEEPENYKYIFDDDVTILNRYKFEKIDNTKEKSNYVIRIDSRELKMPIIIRNKKDGDKINVKNLEGSKKLKDIFIEKKIDLAQRKEYPVVTDSNNEIIWVPGLKKSIFDKEINEKYDIIIKYTEEKNE